MLRNYNCQTTRFHLAGLRGCTETESSGRSIRNFFHEYRRLADLSICLIIQTEGIKFPRISFDYRWKNA